MAIQEFRATPLKSVALNAAGAGIFAGAPFVVVARFDVADAAGYEYRQYVKGTAIMQQGSFWRWWRRPIGHRKMAGTAS